MSKKRAHGYKHNNIHQLTEGLINNGYAMTEGPTKRKTWSPYDLKVIKPMTHNQKEMFREFMDGQNICAYGSAGTGKTYVAIYLALNDMLRKDTPTEKIIIVRSAVPTRSLGFTPGTLEEKAALYEAPYHDMFRDFLGKQNTYQNMKEAGLVEFCTTSYILDAQGKQPAPVAKGPYTATSTAQLTTLQPVNPVVDCDEYIKMIESLSVSFTLEVLDPSSNKLVTVYEEELFNL